MIRAEKGTPNQNAVRTLLLGVSSALIILVGIDPALKLYDEHIRPRPWLTADIEIQPRREGDPPDIVYAVHAPSYVVGDWKAWVETRVAPDFWLRGRGGSGNGTYGPRTAMPRSWGWSAFFEADVPVPAQTYRVCVSYDVNTARGVPADFGPYCSELHDPRMTK